MYVERIQLNDYGPIHALDIRLPFTGDNPKPVVFVGENSSGKSILLSHIANGMVSAQQTAYPDTPEVEAGRVFKLRSPFYIRYGAVSAFSRVDFESGWHLEELMLRTTKSAVDPNPLANPLPEDAADLWQNMKPDSHDAFSSNFRRSGRDEVAKIFSENCLLYFPHDRFEEPAWLNSWNLTAAAKLTDRTHLAGSTDRRVINYSPMRDIHNWVFDVLFDRQAFELRTVRWNPETANTGLDIFAGYQGTSSRMYELIRRVLGEIVFGSPNLRFGVGNRSRRVLSVESDAGQVVPNLFQMSSGQTALLGMFLAILRDFDMSGAPLNGSEDVRGIVVIDEIELHLHVSHQRHVLPRLMKMFPRVQFIVTTHSPLVVLGMSEAFGDNGFGLYRLPDGDRISPEEFSEFGAAYEAFQETSAFSNDVRKAVSAAQRPLLFVDGTTDIQYLETAAKLLEKEEILGIFDTRDGRGDDNLKKVWEAAINSDLARQPIVLLHDCDSRIQDASRGAAFRRKIPQCTDHPIKRGVENLFNYSTVLRAKNWKSAFINVEDAHPKTVRGIKQVVPETWTVDEDEKTNLCNWLCANGTADDFAAFVVVFEMLEDVMSGF